MSLTLDKKLFLFLSLGFILFTIIGTLSHELAHYLMARFLGYSANLSYNMTYTENIIPGSRDSFLVTLAGPVQTMLTGTIGFLLLIFYRTNLMKSEPGLKAWLLVLLSLFWLRQIVNLLLIGLNTILDGKLFDRNDEMNLSCYLNFSELSLNYFTAGIALLIFVFVVASIPKAKRFTFLAALGFGSCSGFITWMYFLGPLILPIRT